jgi:hypothetical protein
VASGFFSKLLGLTCSVSACHFSLDSRLFNLSQPVSLFIESIEAGGPNPIHRDQGQLLAVTYREPGGVMQRTCLAALSWPLFGRLARAVGADPEEAIKAAQECRSSAEERRRSSGGREV